MSVINQMLNDLDKRKQHQVRQAPVWQPQTQSGKLRLWLAAGLVILAGICGVYYWLYLEQPEAAPVAAPQEPVEPAAAVTQSQPAKAEKVVPKPLVVLDTPLKTEQKSQVTSRERVSVARPPAKKTPSEPKVTTTEKEEAAVLSVKAKAMSAADMAQNAYKRGLEAKNMAELVSAREAFEQALVHSPSHVEAREQLAAIFFSLGEINSALSLLQNGQTIHPELASFKLMEARLWQHQEHNERALSVLSQLSPDPVTQLEYWLFRAGLEIELKAFEQADKTYSQLLGVWPEAGRVWLGKALALDGLGLYSQASEAYRIALEKRDLSTSGTRFVHQRLTELELAHAPPS